MQNGIYLISLNGDEARRNALKERFKSYDKFNIISAIDGRIMNAKEYFGYAFGGLKAYDRLLSPAEVGCALSHVKAYEEFLKSGAEFGLIFEDDVIGDDEGISEAFKFAQKMKSNSVLICGCQDGLEGRFSAFGKRIEENFWLVSNHSKGVIYRAAAYAVDQKSAKAMLDIHKKALCTADFWQILLKDSNMYFSEIFSHPTDLADSNIQGERVSRGAEQVGLKAYFNSLRYIFKTRLESKINGYERIFKRDFER